MAYPCESWDHPEIAEPAFDQVVDVGHSLFDARVDHEWPCEQLHAGAPIDADRDMSEEILTQRANDALRMQKSLYNILR